MIKAKREIHTHINKTPTNSHTYTHIRTVRVKFEIKAKFLRLSIAIKVIKRLRKVV